MEIFQIIEIVVSLVVLVSFFLLSSNVARIKQEFIDLEAHRRNDIRRAHNLNYQACRVIGDKGGAYRSMVLVMMHDLTIKEYSEQRLRQEYEYFKTKNEAKFTELGYPFPEYPFTKP